MSPSLTNRRALLLALAHTDPRVHPALAWLEDQRIKNPHAQIYVYCLSKGITCLNHPSLLQLQRDGVRVFACAKSASEHGIPIKDQATFGGLGLLTDLLLATDSFVSLGPSPDCPWPPPEPPTLSPHKKRLVHLTIRGTEIDPGRASEALRIATALLSEDRLQITTSCPQTKFSSWLELCHAPDQIAELPKSWQAFLEARGNLLTQDSQPPPPSDHLAFAVIPF